MSNKIIASAPLLSSLRERGGTMISLSTFVNDLSYLFDESDTKIVPSKFVALKLPKWVDANTQHMFVDPLDLGTPTNSDPNYTFAKSWQNYLENYLQYSEGSRTDLKVFRNTGEQAFWKFLQYVGALKLEDTGIDIVHDSTAKSLYREKASDLNYEQIIKYVGEINLANHVKQNGVEYMEFFMHIPTDAGAATNIDFVRSSLEHNASAIPVGGGNAITHGLEEYDGTASVNALYDIVGDKTYQVDRDIDRMNLMLNSALSDSTKRNAGNFDFNAILLYYDMYSGANPEARQTNCYGLLLLEPFTVLTAGSGIINSFTKLQPDSVQPGNAYSFRLNLKFSNVTNQVTSEISINDYSTVSMEMYMDALRKMKSVMIEYEKLSKDMLAIKNTTNILEQTILNTNKIIHAANLIENLDNRLSNIEGSQIGINNDRIVSEDLLKLFVQMTSDIKNTDKIINNQIIVSSRAFLPTVLNATEFIIEANDGLRYKYNVNTKAWDLIEL